VEFVPGKYSAEHGGYLGGRINIVPKTGDENQAYPTKISLGLLSSKISTGKKFGNNSYFFSYRRSYLDLIEKMVSDNSSYYFADFHGGYKYQINNKNSISFHYYYSKDVFTNFLEKDEDEIKGLTQPFWGNKLYSFKWQYTNKLNIKILSHIYSSVSKAYSNTTHIDINNELMIMLLQNSISIIVQKPCLYSYKMSIKLIANYSLTPVLDLDGLN